MSNEQNSENSENSQNFENPSTYNKYEDIVTYDTNISRRLKEAVYEIEGLSREHSKVSEEKLQSLTEAVEEMEEIWKEDRRDLMEEEENQLHGSCVGGVSLSSGEGTIVHQVPRLTMRLPSPPIRLQLSPKAAARWRVMQQKQEQNQRSQLIRIKLTPSQLARYLFKRRFSYYVNSLESKKPREK